MSDLLRIPGRATHLANEFHVRRLLPAAARRSVGPFIFFDHFGPVTLAAESNSDLGVHPHIGIATVTYLFEGSLLHRDSLGTVQTITPGAINWMTAGRGIAHSERTVDTERGKERRQHGLQLWVALPPDQETVAPSFQHVAAADLPLLELEGGVQIRVLAGSAFDRESPVKTLSATLYLDVYLPPGHEFTLPVLASEMALYSPEHALVIDGQEVAGQQLVVLQQAPVILRAGPSGARLVIIGGAPLEKPVRMWWNFVSTDRSRIAAAARRWNKGLFEQIRDDADVITAPQWKD
ncbi:pirin family protein [Undibacterium sp. 14-3-2]|uniref:pirin family protein n=1 Tax=Undibacterium sp. 14-3-2 TaxID=2800129 RepID=UPI0019084628|nr:pirin family protein [Undibacterium sp. 14-3-2]MBK1889235.1 pirin family protein [Undibacterium sp. 14-3-2]